MGRTDQESDARIERMDRVAVLHGEITAATREFLRALAESDRHRDWEDEGFGSCAEWLAWQVGITKGTANEKVRAARALEDLPLISEAMSKGELSFSKVRALTRAATPDNEADLLEFAQAGSAANLERLVRGWKTLSRLDEQQQERARHGRRRFSILPDEDGMYVVKGLLDPEVGAALMRAVEAASDALFAESAKDDGERTEPQQLRADAMGLLAERALAAGFHGGGAPVSGSRAERYQVVLHVEAETLSDGREPGLSELEDGTRVSAETARRLACDASRVENTHAGSAAGSANASTNASTNGSANGSANGSTNGSANQSTNGTRNGSPSGLASGASTDWPIGLANSSVRGSVLDVGRRTRTIPPALRRALDARDRGCRFPGCGLRFTDAHHIVHWADGGETTLDNTILLCRRHHRRLHEGGYQICTDRNGQAVFFTPKGKALLAAPPPPELPDDPVEALVRGNRERGVTPGYSTGSPRWKRDWDIPWAIEAAAREAIDPSDGPVAYEASAHDYRGGASCARESYVRESPVGESYVRESSVGDLSVDGSYIRESFVRGAAVDGPSSRTCPSTPWTPTAVSAEIDHTAERSQSALAESLVTYADKSGTRPGTTCYDRRTYYRTHYGTATGGLAKCGA